MPHKSRICSSISLAPTLFLLILISIFPLGLFRLVAVADSPDWTAYYPLAVGNIWTYKWIYKGNVAGGRKSGTVRWEVQQTLEEDGKRVYLVVPQPIQIDDDYLELSVGPGGVEEVRHGIFLLKFPVIVGQHWSKEYQSVLKNREVSRKFSVLSAGKPCSVGRFKFSDCVVVEDSDEELDLKTVTTYARNVGPVAYEYFRRAGAPTVDKFFESFALLSHDLKSSK
jgi:hypothetical protein